MKHLGKKIVRDEVHFVPAKLHVERHISHSYQCNCHDPLKEAKQIKATPVPKALFSSGSIVSSSLLAEIFHLKFVLSVPLYRQVNDWMRHGLSVTRKTLSNWVMAGSHDYLFPMYELLLKEMRSRDVIGSDETPYQILNRSDGKKATSEARLWALHTSSEEDKPVVIYHSSLTRSRDEFKQIIGDYTGYVHCDGFSSYKHIQGVKTVCCWAHLRRYFKDVPHPKGMTNTKAHQAIKKIDKMFKLERRFKHLSPEERSVKRNHQLEPLITEFFDWVASFPALGSLSKAVNYALNQKESLIRVLEDGRLQLSNNLCEQRIKTVVIGRKNHLFSTSERGATANAIAYSIIATARENGLDPWKYMALLFEKLPNIAFYRNPSALEAFLPWVNDIQQLCKALPSTNQLTA
jgi:transposase